MKCSIQKPVVFSGLIDSTVQIRQSGGMAGGLEGNLARRPNEGVGI